MTKNQFEKIEKEEGFEEAMQNFCLENDTITNCDGLLQFAKDKLNDDEILLASHILNALIKNDCWEGFWRYDFCMGTLETPTTICKIEDIEDLFEEE